MDQHDTELLDKQLRGLNPAPRDNGVVILAVLAVFFAGMALGGFLVGYKSEPMRIAANDAAPAISIPSAVAPTLRR